MTLALAQDTESGPAASPTTATAAQRLGFVDAFRGLLIAHMALDHASLMFNAGRGGEELATAQPELSVDIFQFPHAIHRRSGGSRLLLHGGIHGGADEYSARGPRRLPS